MEYAQSKVYIYVDGLIVYEGKLKLFSVKELNNTECQKRYEPLESTMSLNKKQKKRLIKGLKKYAR